LEEELARSLYYNPDTDTLDIWLGDPSSEVHSESITDNLVGKHNARDDIIGYEVIALSKLNNEDMKKMSAEVRAMLKQSVTRLSIVTHPRK